MADPSQTTEDTGMPDVIPSDAENAPHGYNKDQTTDNECEPGVPHQWHDTVDGEVCAACLARRPSPTSFTCPDCGLVSHHPRDVAERWCNRCKMGALERAEREWLERARASRTVSDVG